MMSAPRRLISTPRLSSRPSRLACRASATPTPPTPLARISSWIQSQSAKSAALRAKMSELGLAAVLTYGLFDALTYTTAFCIAFVTYEAQTGINPTTNVKAVVAIMVAMWAGNNVTRPFRVAGAAAMAPLIAKFLKLLQSKFKLPNEVTAFALVVSLVAGICLSIVGTLFLSRMGGA